MDQKFVPENHLEGTEKVPSVNDYYNSYKGFATALRTWLIAYGIGVPLLIVTQKTLWEAISYENAGLIATQFLAGACLQAFHTFLFKWAQWKLYISANQSSKRPRIATWVSSVYLFDFVADFGSIILFAIGTGNLVISVVNGP